jgi:transposase
VVQLIGFCKNISPAQRSFLEALRALCPDLAISADISREFYRMVAERDASAWTAWQQAASQSQLHRFAAQLQHDEAAVCSALTLPWSTGPVEGHIHRLKLIKRQMYGRAKLDLLRVRMLNVA